MVSGEIRIRIQKVGVHNLGLWAVDIGSVCGRNLNVASA